MHKFWSTVVFSVSRINLIYFKNFLRTFGKSNFPPKALKCKYSYSRLHIIPFEAAANDGILRPILTPRRSHSVDVILIIVM